MSSKVVTRFAPSPTGKFHIGGIRSALYNYLYARKNGGKFILRSDDTDQERSKKEYEDYFLEIFEWLGLDYDEFYRQSERTSIYKNYLEKMIADGTAYVSKEVPQEEGQREEVIRLKNPNKDVVFVDEILGEIKFNTTEHGDFVIARDLETPLYNFTSVIDDHELGVTHIIRGQDHISNTPRQILIIEAIGATRPKYIHGSMILNSERAKLSKRDPGVFPVMDYKNLGYLPDAILNFCAFLGWNPGGEKEIFTKQELIEAFNIEGMQKSNAAFNPVKLDWINKEHMKKLSDEDFKKTVMQFKPVSLSEATFEKLIPDLKERLSYFGELKTMDEAGEFDFYTKTPSPSEDLIVSNTKVTMPQIKDFMSEVAMKLESVSEFTKENIKSAIWDFATEKGRGNVLWPMRVILTGKEKSPDPFTVAEILGKEETIKRLVNVK